MQELKFDQVEDVNGGSGGELAFGLGASWASTVVGGAIGAVKGGLKGAAIGGPAGFVLGAVIATAFVVATSNR